MDIRPPTVISFGGGVNSYGLVLGLIERNAPPPTHILFGDTGGELPHTYEGMARFSEYLTEHGWPAVRVLRRARRDGRWLPLEDDCLEKATLPAIAFGYKTCSQKYKVEPQDKFLNSDPQFKAWWKSGQRAVKVIGYDAGEVRRARFGHDNKYDLKYPLIEWGWTRADCVAAANRHGFNPGKSSCFFCPHMRKNEIDDLAQQHPDLLARALYMESNAKLTKIKGLGRRFAWRDYVAGQPTPDRTAGELDEPCGCWDGSPNTGDLVNG